ncbi:hypothetical protein ABPG72_001967 [Tetrahymena utriculariae]
MSLFNVAQDYIDFTSEQAYGMKDSNQNQKSHKFFKVLQKITVGEKRNDYILERVKGQLVQCPIEQNNILRRGIKYNNYSELNFEYIAQNYKLQKKYRLAMRYLDIGLSMYPKSHQLILEKGSLLIEMRQYNEAIKALQYGLQMIEKNQELSDRIVEQKFVGLYNLGIAYEEDDCLEIALTYYEQCQQIDDQDYDVLYSMIGIYSDLEQHQSALNILYSIIELNPAEIKAFIEISRIFVSMQDYESMQRQMNNLIEINEGNDEELAQVYIQWSELLLSLDMAKEALDKTYLAQKFHSKDQKILITQAKVLSYLGRHEEALKILQIYYERNSSDHNVLSLIANEYLQIGCKERALQLFQSAINISNQQEPQYYYMLGRAQYYCNEYEKAIESLNINQEKSNQQMLQCQILLAHSYSHLKQNSKAIELYEQSIQLISRKNINRLKRLITLNEFNQYLKYNQDKYNLKQYEEIQHYLQKRLINLKNIAEHF